MMFRMKLTGSLVLLVLLTFSTLTVINSLLIGKAQTTTTVLIDPAATSTQIDNYFSVDVNVSEVNDLCSWQVYIYFLRQIVEATAYAEGPFLKDHGPTLFDGSINNSYNATHGRLWMYALRTWNGMGVNGSGTLGLLTFKAKYGGTTDLSLRNTILGNSTAQRMDHITMDGLVEVGTHDVAITEVTPLKTVVGQNLKMRIEVIAQNQGNYTETFNATAYANTTQIAIQEVTLNPGAETTITYTWNVTGIPKGVYTISAYATPVQYEVDMMDNNSTDGVTRVSMTGDITEQFGTVDIYDLVYVASSFGAENGKPPPPAANPYHPNIDLIDDNIIDIFDIVVVATNFGSVDP